MPSRLEARTPSPAALWRVFWRPGISQLIVGVLLCAVTAASILTVRSRANDATHSTARRDDLIAMIDSLDTDSRRLEREIVDLEATLEDLKGSADKAEAAAQEAAKRQSSLSILAGTVPAHGPGIRLLVMDPDRRVTSQLLLDVVAELRDAGAEVIEVDDRFRVVASTWFDGPGGLAGVNGNPLGERWTIEAIGDPHSLEEGARFRGGLVSRLQSTEVGARVDITRLDDVTISSTVDLPTPSQARPR